MKQFYHPSAEEITLAGVLYALSDPLRLSIVHRLATEGEKACGTFGLAVAKSTLSHHFRVLRESGLIHTCPSGASYINRLRLEVLEERFPNVLKAILSAYTLGTSISVGVE